MGFSSKKITLMKACKDLQNIRYVGVFVQVGFVQVAFDCNSEYKYTFFRPPESTL